MTGPKAVAYSFVLLAVIVSGAAAPITPKGLPAIARGQILAGDDWDAASKRFTAFLQQKFPAGADETKLAQALLRQGFRYPPSGKPGCIPEKDWLKMPPGRVYQPCPTYDRHRTLVYEWQPADPSGFVCQHFLVDWQARGGKITAIRAQYDMVCV